MPSTRKGFSQRVAGGGNALRMGTVIRLGIEGRTDVAMMVSAIVSPGSDEGALYVLLTAHSPIRDYASDVRCSLIRGPGQSRLPLGTFVAPGSVLGSSAEKLGFHVLRLDETPLFGAATESACRLATTRNFRKVIWDAGTFKVRRLNAEEMPLDPVRLRQRRPYLDNRMGRVAGDIDDVEIRDVGRTLHYAYCGLVTRGRNRPLGDSASLGAPLLSRSGALSAIIVGAAENDTLVLPVEELRKEASLDFVTLGGDWPKVRVKPRAPSHDPAAAVRRRVSAPTPDRQPVLRRRFRAGDIAVDLGSTNTVIHVRGRGIVLNEPSVMAVETLDGVLKVRAVGDDAIVIAAQGTGSIELIRPLRNGVFAALDLAEEMIRQFVRKLGRENAFAVGRLRVVLAVPTGSSSSERHAIRDAAIRAGAGEIYLIDESIAAAIGAGMPIAEKRGSMVVDIGGGSTEVTILSSRGLAYTASIRVGGDKMDEAIVSYVRRNHALLIGEATAERIKQEVGCAKPPIDRIGAVIHIKGRDPVNGVPREAHISQGQVAEALSEPVGAIIEGVRLALENAAPEVAADIVDKGMVIMGGGALLKGLDEVLRDETGLPVVVAAYPLMCVVSGAASAMDMNDIELTPLLA